MLTRRDPFLGLSSLQERMNRLFDDAFARFGFTDGQLGWGVPSLIGDRVYTVPVDVYEDDQHLTVKFEVPGIDERDLKVQIENNVLTVSGERKFEDEENRDNYRRIERRYGAFARSFTLPNTVDADSLKADYINGVLEVRMAKRAEAKPKQIKINAGQKALKAKEAVAA
jgi:HSP20 family protein